MAPTVDSPADNSPGPLAPRELDGDQALALAMSWHGEGRLDDAEAVYRALLRLRPDWPEVQHFLGMLLAQRARPEELSEALALLRGSLVQSPDNAAWHSNLGNALLQAGQGDAALQAYRRSAELAPGNAGLLNNLGVLLRRQGQLQEAEAAFRQALVVQPELADAHINCASLLASQHRLPEAMAHQIRSLELRSHDPVARRLLGILYLSAGRREQALPLFQEWAGDEPDNIEVQHHLAALTGQGVPDRASNDYVARVFDRFAQDFDQRLAQLDYRAPQLIGERLLALLGPAPASPTRVVLDAGCGTGLCVPWLRPHAHRLVGVDLSRGMVEQAAQRGGYDQLVVQELVDYLVSQPAVFDLLVSADTLCYFGALEAVAAASHAALRPGGWLLFTVEWLGEPEAPVGAAAEAGRQQGGGAPALAGPGYQLNLHGRYSHRPAHVQALLAEAGFEQVVYQRVVLRREGMNKVWGGLFSARRAGDGSAG